MNGEDIIDDPFIAAGLADESLDTDSDGILPHSVPHTAMRSLALAKQKCEDLKRELFDARHRRARVVASSNDSSSD